MGNKLKLETIDNVRTFLIVSAMTSEDERLCPETFLTTLVNLLLTETEDQGYNDGIADGLLRFYKALIEDEAEEAEADYPVYLDVEDAEERMRLAYIIGYALATKQEKNARNVREMVESGNSGWRWPPALTYGPNVEIPVEVCEQFGVRLGHLHGRQALAWTEYCKSQQRKESAIE